MAPNLTLRPRSLAPRLPHLALFFTLWALGLAGCTSMPSEAPDDGGSADLMDPPCSCAVGSKRCEGSDRVAVCEMMAAGCASWGPAVTCPSGMCTMGACVGSCQDACPAGVSRCSGDAAVEVCRIGTSGCLEWVKQACPTQNFCDPGTGVCAPSVPCDACPTGYMCSRSGTCTGGDPTMIGLDVKTVRFAGKITLNGADPANGPDCARRPASEKARLTLRETTKGYQFALPLSCNDAGFTFSGILYPGTYRVLVQGSSDGYRYSDLPLVPFAAESALAITTDTSGKVLDVKTVRFAGKITLNGADPANGPDCARRPASEKARVTLSDSSTGSSFSLPLSCSDAGFTYSGTIYPGTYRVSAMGSSDGYKYSDLPLQPFVTDPMLAVAADVSGKTLDVKTVRFAGKITLNGADPANGPDCARRPASEKARVVLAETTRGTSFSLPLICNDSGFVFSGTIHPGTYRVSAQGSSDGYKYSELPLVPFVTDPMLAVAADVSGKTLDVKTVRFAGKITLNGADPANGPDCARRPASEKARVLLTETSKGTSFSLPLICSDSGFTFSGTIHPGTYRVSAQGSSDGYKYSDLPLVPFLADASLAVAADISGKVLDVKTVKVSGKITLNGADPANGPDCARRPASEKARITLSETTKGAVFILPMLCSDSGFAWSGEVYPGTYRVTVQGSSDGYRYSELPLVGFVADTALLLNSDTPGKTFDVKTVRVGGKVTLNAMDPSNGPDCARLPGSDKASVSLTEITHGYVFRLPMSCGSAAFTFAGSVYPGTYRAGVQGLSDGRRYSDIPLELWVAASRIQIP